MYLSRFLFFSLFLAITTSIFAQEKQVATVFGKVTDENGNPFPFVSVRISEINDAFAETDFDGNYRLIVPAGTRFSLEVSQTGYRTQNIVGIRLKPDQIYQHDFQLAPLSEKIGEITVTAWDSKEADAQKATQEDIKHIPTTTLNLESVLQFIAVGVSAGTGGELTSQYSVRGGNYDENLIYVNGFEIYRPLLIRSGQQEGLTFPNPDMLSHLYFSSGGFRAEYGDKMASVLDVYYRRPKRPFEGSVTASLLGASAYIGGAVYKDSSHYKEAKRTRFEEAYPQRFTYTLGARYKTTQYLLGGLDVDGQYVPNFIDLQGNLIYDFNSMWQIEAIGNYSNSIYRLIPESGVSTTGLFNQALRLSTNFEGQEISNFETFMTGVSLTFKSLGQLDLQGRVRMRLLASHYQSYENERIDIQSLYRLEEVQTGLGEDNFGEVIGTLVYGETHDYARNFLKSKVTNIQYRGDWIYQKDNSFDQDSITKVREHDIALKWGVGYKNEIIIDDLKEWRRYDSLDYTVPYDTGGITMDYYLRTNINLNSHRMTGFLQSTWEHKTNKNHWRITAGVRAQYWTINKEFLVS
ncbi:MAG: TonB-dependent receptor, partial [Saprospiraceae bacterium]|nr:TonB-dependent receptor [Saprospiraceae bacterium]